MGNYKHILLAVDFFEPAQVVIDRAKSLAETYKASFSIIHVVDNMALPDVGYALDTAYDIDLTSEMIDAARKKLFDLGKKLGVEEGRLWVELGSPKLEINRIAEENQVDLIVVGSHGRHGFALLLGSTANGVLHHAKCDVLAVRLQDN
ncbi:universal stress protein [Methyloglobulus sp.]|uniref:universal stress protein n=1 Tax=Methyloglobulus sp. TaxID=2518622 RepID=UPI0032B706CB